MQNKERERKNKEVKENWRNASDLVANSSESVSRWLGRVSGDAMQCSGTKAGLRYLFAIFFIHPTQDKGLARPEFSTTQNRMCLSPHTNHPMLVVTGGGRRRVKIFDKRQTKCQNKTSKKNTKKNIQQPVFADGHPLNY